MKQNKIYGMIHCFNQNIDKLKKQIDIASKTSKYEGVIFNGIDTTDPSIHYNEKEIKDFIEFVKSSSVKIGVVRYDDTSIKLDKFIDKYELLIDFELCFDNKGQFECLVFKDKTRTPVIGAYLSTPLPSDAIDCILENKVLKPIIYLPGIKDTNKINVYIDQIQDNVCGFIIDFNEENNIRGTVLLKLKFEIDNNYYSITDPIIQRHIRYDSNNQQDLAYLRYGKVKQLSNDNLAFEKLYTNLNKSFYQPNKMGIVGFDEAIGKKENLYAGIDRKHKLYWQPNLFTKENNNSLRDCIFSDIAQIYTRSTYYPDIAFAHPNVIQKIDKAIVGRANTFGNEHFKVENNIGFVKVRNCIFYEDRDAIDERIYYLNSNFVRIFSPSKGDYYFGTIEIYNELISHCQLFVDNPSACGMRFL